MSLLEDYVALVAAIEATARALELAGAPRRLPAARRSAPRPLRGHARSRRDRGQHPSGRRLGRAQAPRAHALRGGAPGAARHREVHARRAPHRHRRRQPRDARRADGGRQPAAAPPRPAAQPHHLLAEPSGALVSLLRHVHRPHQPEPARGRGAQRHALRAGDRLRADRRDSSSRARRTRSPGWWTGSCAISSSTSPATPTARNSRSTSCTRPDSATGRLGPAGVPRLRDAAARAHEPAADAAAARAGRALLDASLSRAARALGHAPARRVHAAALRGRRTCAT